MSKDNKTPVLSSLSVQATSLVADNLSDPDHPVNIKGESGKRAGLSVMIGEDIYVAMGSAPLSPWRRLPYSVEPDILEPTAIYRTLDNTALTNVTDDLSLMVNAVTNAPLVAVETFLSGNWAASTTEYQLQYTGNEAIVKVTVSGSITASTGFGFTNNCRVALLDNTAGSFLTGSDKVYPLGATFGAVTNAGFTLVGYASVSTGDLFTLQVGGDFEGAVTVDNVLWAVEPIVL